MSDLLKREDVPFEIAMALSQNMIENHPGKTIEFAGDIENPPPEMLEFVRKFDEVCHKSLTEGVCWGCGAPVPGWPDDVNFDEGTGDEFWGHIMMEGKDHAAYECPTCNGPKIDDPGFGIATVNEDGSVHMSKEFKEDAG
jgi:hypothetical protein